MGDAITALQETIKCVEAAIRVLGEARLNGQCAVKQNGILWVLRGVIGRLNKLCDDVEAL